MIKHATLAAALLLTSLPAQAQCGAGCGALFGFLGGTIVGSSLSRPTVIYTQPQTVYVLPAPQPYYASPVNPQPYYASPVNPLATGRGCWQEAIGRDPTGAVIYRSVCY